MNKYGKENSWKTFEIRGGKKFLKSKPSTGSFLVHTLNLEKKNENDQHSTPFVS